MFNDAEHKRLPNWGKVANWKQAKELTDTIRSMVPAGTIVLANGTFDLLHPGHIYFLAWARYQGSFLVVSVDDDDTAHARGKSPVMPLEDRMALVASLPSVGLVTTHGDDPGPFRHLDLPEWSVGGDRRLATLIRLLRPDVKARTNAPGPDVELEAMASVKAKIKTIERFGDWSSTALRNRAASLRLAEVQARAGGETDAKASTLEPATAN